MVEMSESSRWEKELAQFQKVLANPTGQAIVIVGPAGSGKSALLGTMVLRGKKGEKFQCDGNIYRVGPSDRTSSILQKIGSEYGEKMVYIGAKFVLERLRESVEEFGDLQRRVVGVDAYPTQPADFEREWSEIIQELPPKVKFIFTQRPDGILATNKQFMGLPNVVRIDIEAPPASDERQKVFDTDEDLRIAFEKYLVKEKGYTSENYSTVDFHGKYPVTRIWDNEHKILALIAFCLERSRADEAFEGIMEYKENQGIKGVPNCVIFANEIKEKLFAMLEYEDGGDTNELPYWYFPTFEVAKFVCGLSSFCSILTRMVLGRTASLDLNIEVSGDGSYINLRRGTKNVAVQIHKYGISQDTIGLALAGYSKEYPDPKSENIEFGKITELSGHQSGIGGERSWLNGNMGRQICPASVYVVDSMERFDASVLKEVLEEVMRLVALAKEKMLEVIGNGGDEIKAKGTIQEHVKVEASAKVEVIGELQSRGMSVAEHGWGDRIADKDKLGFRPYVEVVARFLTHEETELPLTLSVEGEWGSGKSSFLSQLKNEIGRIYKEKGEEEAFIVEFDPWRHDKDEALWAAFALKFIGDASKCLTKRKRWEANYELWKQRFNWKQAWPDVLRIVLVGLAWILATVGICIGLWNGIKLGATGTVVLPKRIGSIVALVVSLWAVFGKVKDFLGSPLAVDLKKYMRRPDYVSKVSFIEKFHDDFKKIVSAYAGEERVYVFVDDLDRCEVPKAAELMESINLMISENPKLVFVMGMDREKVAAGLAVKHEKLLPYLAEPTEKKDEAKRRRGLRYGYTFIEKFIQVPFRLPLPDEECIKEMLMGMSGQLKEEKAFSKKAGAKAEEQPPSEPSGEVPETKKDKMKQAKIEDDKKLEAQRRAETKDTIDKVFTKFDGDDHNFRAIVLMVSKAFDFNPRRAKQFVNIFRLRAATAKVTGLYEPKDGKRLTFEQLGKFVGIGLGWPLLIRDIERKPALLEELVGEAEGRTEGEANEKKDPKKNGLRFEKWADDEKLMELLKAGCENEKDAEKCRRFSLKGLDVNKLLQVAPRVMSDEEEMV